MNRPDLLFDRITDFKSAQLGVDRKKIALRTRLLQDLGVDGDDAVEFFDRFGECFAVDVADLHAHWNLHFGPEGFLPWIFIRDLVATAFHQTRSAEKLMPITIADLMHAAQANRWSYEYRPQRAIYRLREAYPSISYAPSGNSRATGVLSAR